MAKPSDPNGPYYCVLIMETRVIVSMFYNKHIAQDYIKRTKNVATMETAANPYVQKAMDMVVYSGDSWPVVIYIRG